MSNFLVLNGFIKVNVDTILFTKHIDNDILIVQIYVNNIIFGSTTGKLCKNFELCMKKDFEMIMIGELNYFLGSKSSKGVMRSLSINPSIQENFKKFGLENAKINKTPMAITTKLDKDEQDKNVNIKLYHNMIDSLLYLTASRLDIMFSVFFCARFQSCPKESHLIVVKHIIRYLKGTTRMDSWYLKTGQFPMMSYSDADYAGCRVDKKSTSGTCQFLEN